MIEPNVKKRVEKIMLIMLIICISDDHRSMGFIGILIKLYTGISLVIFLPFFYIFITSALIFFSLKKNRNIWVIIFPPLYHEDNCSLIGIV